jgi:hypothetical protein
VEEAVVKNLARTPRPPRTVMLRQMVSSLQSIVTLAHQAGYPGTTETNLCVETKDMFL